jgi:hypothetical protein
MFFPPVDFSSIGGVCGGAMRVGGLRTVEEDVVSTVVCRGVVGCVATLKLWRGGAPGDDGAAMSLTVCGGWEVVSWDWTVRWF